MGAEKNERFKLEPKEQGENRGVKYEGLNGVKSQLEWIKRQLEYASFSEKYKLRYNLKRGEIYEFDWGYNVNVEFSNRHYGVVLADSNEFNPLVIVCPLKTNRHGAHPRSDVDLGFIEGLREGVRTLAVVNQIRTLDKMRLYTKTAIAEESEMEEVPKLEQGKIKLILAAYQTLLYETIE
ncbi:MAG: type II toxin-antitoxin system PemK/MazF family toxin [Bacilli bacterium]